VTPDDTGSGNRAIPLLGTRTGAQPL